MMKIDLNEQPKVLMPYNELLTNFTCSGPYWGINYWPSVVFVQTSLSSVRTATTSGQYSPVRPSRSVSKRWFLLRWKSRSSRIISLLADTLVSRQLYLQLPWQNPVWTHCLKASFPLAAELQLRTLFCFPRVSAYGSFNCVIKHEVSLHA